MQLTSENKESLRKVLACFKKAGVDISTVAGVKADTVHVEFTIEAKGKEITVGVESGTGDVYYEYFTSRDKIGNVSDPTNLTATIKDGTQDKQMDVNKDDNTDENAVSRLKEAIKKIIRGEIAEESATGAGASFSAGEGEQYATPNAFKKKKLKEDVSYTPDKSQEIINKYDKEFAGFQSQSERLYNLMGGFALADLLEDGGEDKIDKISDTAEALKDKLDKIYHILLDVQDSMDDHDDIRDKAVDLDIKYHKLGSHVWQIYHFTYKIRNVKDDLKEHELEELINYKK